ncbi:MAG: membrane protein insertion efficiency factor YidD [Prolixibacteraceae bacterium]|jgi:putative membrane protein insertion efficiency factor|nr:membrane protein insertion efficiency factor YidD [Prolixibacteraceae bacterium]
MHCHYKINKYLRILLITIVLFVGIAKTNFAQSLAVINDLELIENTKLSKQVHQHKRPYIYKNQPKSFKTLNPISLTYGGLLFVYQNSISQHFSADCLYYPTCSDFSKQCVHSYGLVRGGLLTFDRLNRCNRIAGADLHQSDVDSKYYRYNDPISKYK